MFPPNDEVAARVGTVLRRKYRLERLIGCGGMAAVYEAVHRNGCRVAIKMLHHHLSISPGVQERFLREGYVANKVGHPGVVRVLDDDVAEDGSAFLVMDLLEGETAEAFRLRLGGRLSEKVVCRLAGDLLEVLAKAHSRGIVHRDIKPDNLFLSTEGLIKVLDFGIARLRERGRQQNATQTGITLGTPAFMAPEQALGRVAHIDERTDVYSVGATMFTLLAGVAVQHAETVEEMLVRVGSSPARRLETVAPEVTPALASVVDKALAFERDQRWSSASAMSIALSHAVRACRSTSARAVHSSASATVSDRQADRTIPVVSPPAEIAVPTLAASIADQALSAPRRTARSVGAWLTLVLLVAVAGIVLNAVVAPRQSGQGVSSIARERIGSSSAATDPDPSPVESAFLPTAPSGPAELVVDPSEAAVSRVSKGQEPSPSPTALAPAKAVTPSIVRAGPTAPATAVSPRSSPVPAVSTGNLRLVPPPPPRIPRPPAPKSSCDPPYTTDGRGHRQYKVECFPEQK